MASGRSCAGLVRAGAHPHGQGGGAASMGKVWLSPAIQMDHAPKVQGCDLSMAILCSCINHEPSGCHPGDHTSLGGVIRYSCHEMNINPI